METAETRALAERYYNALTSGGRNTVREHPMVSPHVLDALLIDHVERFAEAPQVLHRWLPRRQHR